MAFNDVISKNQLEWCLTQSHDFLSVKNVIFKSNFCKLKCKIKHCKIFKVCLTILRHIIMLNLDDKYVFFCCWGFEAIIVHSIIKTNFHSEN